VTFVQVDFTHLLTQHTLGEPKKLQKFRDGGGLTFKLCCPRSGSAAAVCSIF
jgi:hypothetical protein